MTYTSRLNPAEEIASFATSLTKANIPSEAIRLTEMAHVNTVGAIYGGSTTEAGNEAGDMVRSISLANSSSVGLL